MSGLARTLFRVSPDDRPADRRDDRSAWSRRPNRKENLHTRLTLLLVALVPLAVPAAATPPVHTVIALDEAPECAPKSSVRCGFDILFGVQGTIRITEFSDRDGNLDRVLIVSPGLTYMFVNAATGKSITSNSPDPEHYSFNSTASRSSLPGSSCTGSFLARAFSASMPAEWS